MGTTSGKRADLERHRRPLEFRQNSHSRGHEKSKAIGEQEGLAMTAKGDKLGLWRVTAGERGMKGEKFNVDRRRADFLRACASRARPR